MFEMTNALCAQLELLVKFRLWKIVVVIPSIFFSFIKLDRPSSFIIVVLVTKSLRFLHYCNLSFTKSASNKTIEPY
jgi:hypothetical protein